MTAMPFTAMARTTGVDSLEQKDAFRIMFYNLENLFDTYNDPLTRDDEFTPKGAKRWSEYRYRKKLLDISKVMLALGEWNPPDVIGLCEVENFQVLLDLVTKTPLKSLNYQIVHENSRDQRGIDVALLYNPAHMKKIAHKPIRISDKAGWETRDILLSEMVLGAKDTIHFFCQPLAFPLWGQRTVRTQKIDRCKNAQVLRRFDRRNRSKIRDHHHG